MDGAWRRPPKSLADYGHTEPKRGAEWWGKSVLLTFALFKSEPPSGRNPKWPLPQEWICTRYNRVACQAAIAGKPAPTFDWRCGEYFLLAEPPCGSGLARDSITAICLTDRAARIASKPAPTRI